MSLGSPDPALGSLLVTAILPGNTLKPFSTVLSAEDLATRVRDKAPLLDRVPAGFNTRVVAAARDEDGVLLASGEVRSVRLLQGDNEASLSFVKATTPALLEASGGVNVSDGVVIKGVTLQVATGLSLEMPGLARAEVFVSGPAYGNGEERARVTSLRPAELRNYAWNPGAPSEGYDPEKLKAGAQKTPFTLTTVAYAPGGQTLGETRLTLAVIGQAQVGFDFSK